jgi:hypothetical protein
MRKNLRTPTWLIVFSEDRISGRRITTRYEDRQSLGVHPPPSDYAGSLRVLFDRTLKLEKQVRVSAREIKEEENNTTNVAWRVGRLETQLTRPWNILIGCVGYSTRRLLLRCNRIPTWLRLIFKLKQFLSGWESVRRK